MTRSHKLPGPDHPITIAPFAGRVRVWFAGEIIADTERAQHLHEASYKPVFYIPREDVRADVLRPSTHETWCPYKGAASYHSLAKGEAASENAVWVYETPLPAVAAIAGHLAFYPDRVERIEGVPLG